MNKERKKDLLYPDFDPNVAWEILKKYQDPFLSSGDVKRFRQVPVSVLAEAMEKSGMLEYAEQEAHNLAPSLFDILATSDIKYVDGYVVWNTDSRSDGRISVDAVYVPMDSYLHFPEADEMDEVEIDGEVYRRYWFD